MKRKAITILSFLLFISSVFCFDMTPVQEKEAYAVILTDDGSNLRMRKTPKTGEVVASAPYGHLIQLSGKRTKGKDTIDGISDYWYEGYIDFDYDKCYGGWVFGGYLSKILPFMPYEVYSQYKGAWDINYSNSIKQNPYNLILNGEDNDVAALFAFGILKTDELLESPDKKESEYPAALAVRRKSPFVLETLLLNGAKLSQSNTDDNVLFLCARKFDSEFTRTCLRYGKIDVNFVDKNGHTALWEAVKNQNYETARTLMQYGADPNIGKETPFMLAKDDEWFSNLLSEYKELYKQNQKDFSMKMICFYYPSEGRIISKKYFTLSEIVEFSREGFVSYRFCSENYNTPLQENFYTQTTYKNKYISDGKEKHGNRQLKKPIVVNYNDVANRWDNNWSNWKTVRNEKDQIIKFIRDDGMTQTMEYDDRGNLLWVDGWGFNEYYINEYYENGQLKRISKYVYKYNTGDL